MNSHLKVCVHLRTKQFNLCKLKYFFSWLVVSKRKRHDERCEALHDAVLLSVDSSTSHRLLDVDLSSATFHGSSTEKNLRWPWSFAILYHASMELQI